MREHLEREGRRGHSAIAAAVLRGGFVSFAGWAYEGAPAPDERSLFEIGSITKVFTGALLAEMHLRGEVDLGDPLSRHLSDPRPPWPGREPTLLELATHRSGLPNAPRELLRKELLFGLGIGNRDPWADVDADRYRRMLGATKPKPARRGIRYSSVGFGLLGDALANAGAAPYEELLRDRVLGPLGMQATAIDPGVPVLQGHSARGRPRPPLRDRMPAAGSLRSNATDMVAFLGACLSPGPDRPGPALALAQRPVRRMSRRMSIGLGWMVATPRGKAPVIWHNGGTWGFRSVAGFSPERGCAVVVLSSSARSVDRLGLRLLEDAHAGGLSG